MEYHQDDLVLPLYSNDSSSHVDCCQPHPAPYLATICRECDRVVTCVLVRSAEFGKDDVPCCCANRDHALLDHHAIVRTRQACEYEVYMAVDRPTDLTPP